MIQRIQSVYLLLITVLMSFLLIRPYVSVWLSDGGNVMFYILSIERLLPDGTIKVFERTPLLLILSFLAGATSFFNIFFFSRRLLQIRICIVNTVLMIIIVILMIINFTQVKQTLEVVRHTFRLASLFPIAAIVLNNMAIRSIRKDEALVQSSERMR